MRLLIYYYLSGIWLSLHFMTWCVVKVCEVGSFVAPSCISGTEVTMAIRGSLSRPHMSGWVLQSCLQCFLRPRHATFNCTKTHIATYSMQRIKISPRLFCTLFCFALFAVILSLSEHNFFSLSVFTFSGCLSSSLSFCKIPLRGFSFWTFVCVFFCCVMSH